MRQPEQNPRLRFCTRCMRTPGEQVPIRHYLYCLGLHGKEIGERIRTLQSLFDIQPGERKGV